jgi:hypothetical protein
VRQTADEVTSKAIITHHPQSKFQNRILQLLEVHHSVISTTEIPSYLDKADLDIILRASARLNKRSLVMKLCNIREEDHYLIGTRFVQIRKPATSV